MNPNSSMSLADALSMSLIGFGIVFFILIVLMAMIKIMRAVLANMEAAKAAPASAPAGAAPAAAAVASTAGMVPAKGSLGEIKLHSVDDKTAALVMAIVANEMGAPLNELRFLSIREKK